MATIDTSIDTSDRYLVLASPVLANGTTSLDLHILVKSAPQDTDGQHGEDLIVACYDSLDFRDYLAPVSGKPERAIRPDWARVAREKTIPNQSERARENMPVYIEWARKERWTILASER